MKEISFELSDDERGVSPVIGVILMVAITVILAAVIASFVLGFGGSTESSATAGVEVDGDHNVTVVSLGDNAEGVKCVEGSGDEPTDTETFGVGDTIDCNEDNNVVAVGADGASNATIRTGI